MTKKAVGTVEATSQRETSSGQQFGIKLNLENGGENWFNGWGSIPSDIQEGQKIQLTYNLTESNGKMYRNIEDKEAIDILEEGSSSSESASSKKSEQFNRQNAVKTAGGLVSELGELSGRELQQFKILVEEINHFNENGEWNNLDEFIAQKLSDGEHFNPDSSGSEEDSSSSDSENEEESSEDLQEEMKEALDEDELDELPENEDGEKVLFGENEEEQEDNSEEAEKDEA